MCIQCNNFKTNLYETCHIINGKHRRCHVFQQFLFRQQPSKNQPGEINFAASGKAEFQPFFNKGLLLLHS
jgi:hypothetical protein